MENSNNSVHESFVAEDIRPGDRITIQLKSLDGFKFEQTLSAWRISPLGLEFVSSEDICDKFKPGIKLDVKVLYPNMVVDHDGLVVHSINKERNHTLIAVRWISSLKERNDVSDRRQTRRWSCGEEYLPTGVFSNPLKFNDYVYFKILDISSKGMLIETSMRNKLLTPEMKVSNVVVTFPAIGRYTLKMEIINARVTRKDGRDVLHLGCNFINPDRKLKEYIGQYLLQFGQDLTLETLQNEGLLISSVNNAITFTFTKTEDDYKKVLDLRRRAWISTGKFNEDSREKQFSDEIDARSRILIALYKGQVVASLRLVYTEIGQKFEHEKYLLLPKSLPRRHEVVEITRVVVDPEFRGKDLLYLLFKRACITALQSGKRYVLGNSDLKLLPLYSKLGFQIISDPFEVKGVNVTARLFIGDIHSLIAGKGVNPIVWNLLFSDLTQYLVDVDLVRMTTNDKIRIIGFKCLSPISAVIGSRMANKPRKRT